MDQQFYPKRIPLRWQAILSSSIPTSSSSLSTRRSNDDDKNCYSNGWRTQHSGDTCCTTAAVTDAEGCGSDVCVVSESRQPLCSSSWSRLEFEDVTEKSLFGSLPSTPISRRKSPLTSSTSIESDASKEGTLWDYEESMSVHPASLARPHHGYNNNSSNNSNNKSNNNSSNNNNSDNTDKPTAEIHFANLRRILLRFADRTSMQGIPYIRSSRSTTAKLIWAFLSLLCLLLLSGHLYYLCAVYYSYPKHSTLLLGYSPLHFPAVTFCNVNPIRRSRLGEVPDSLRELVTLTDPETIAEKMMVSEVEMRVGWGGKEGMEGGDGEVGKVPERAGHLDGS
ncbi:hypothetical protein ACOMHN_036417 [Nucella lapillus]